MCFLQESENELFHLPSCAAPSSLSGFVFYCEFRKLLSEFQNRTEPESNWLVLRLCFWTTKSHHPLQGHISSARQGDADSPWRSWSCTPMLEAQCLQVLQSAVYRPSNPARRFGAVTFVRSHSHSNQSRVLLLPWNMEISEAFAPWNVFASGCKIFLWPIVPLYLILSLPRSDFVLPTFFLDFFVPVHPIQSK